MLSIGTNQPPVFEVLFDSGLSCYLSLRDIARVASVSRHFFDMVAQTFYLAAPYAQQLGERVSHTYPTDVRAMLGECEAAPERLSVQCKALLNAQPFFNLNRDTALHAIQQLEATVYAHLVRMRQHPTQVLQGENEPRDREEVLLRAAKQRTLEELFWVFEKLIDVDNALSENSAGDDLSDSFQTWYDLMLEPPFPREEFVSRLGELMNDPQSRESLRLIHNLLSSWQAFSHRVSEALVPLNDVIQREDIDQMPSHLETLLLRLLADIIFGDGERNQHQYACKTGVAIHRYKVQFVQSMIQKHSIRDVEQLHTYWASPHFTLDFAGSMDEAAYEAQIDQCIKFAEDLCRPNVHSFLLEKIQSYNSLPQLIQDVYTRVLALDELPEEDPLRRAFGGNGIGPISFGAAALCLVYSGIFEPKS